MEGALNQDYNPLEILVSDDGSSDNTFEIIRSKACCYQGPHKLIIRRNKKNLGLARHVNCVLDECQGEIIVIAAGDDISYPNRVTQAVSLLHANPACSAVLSSADIINEYGIVVGERVFSAENKLFQTLDDLINNRAKTFGAARAITNELWKSFPALSSECQTEDTPLLVRSLICGCNILSEEKSLAYRVHEKNLSSPRFLKHINVAFIINQYMQDISHALKNSMLDDMKYGLLLSWASDKFRSRILKNDLASNRRLSIDDMVYCIASSSFSLREKAAVLLHLFNLGKAS